MFQQFYVYWGPSQYPPIPKFNVYLRHQGKRNGFIVGFWLSVAHRTCNKYLFCFIIHAKIRVNQGVMDWGVGGSVCVRESFSKEPGFFILCIPECKPSKSFNLGSIQSASQLFFFPRNLKLWSVSKNYKDKYQPARSPWDNQPFWWTLRCS